VCTYILWNPSKKKHTYYGIFGCKDSQNTGIGKTQEKKVQLKSYMNLEYKEIIKHVFGYT